MTTDGYVDGNALGGALMALFGREMTDAMSCCGGCGATNRLGALHVYAQAPGDVARCPGCGAVEVVAVELPSGLRFYFTALRWVEAVQTPTTSGR